jgi:hypothetical protein
MSTLRLNMFRTLVKPIRKTAALGGVRNLNVHEYVSVFSH